MNSTKKRKLAANGWRIGSTQDFLGLGERESAYIELKLKLAQNLKKKRLEKHLTQIDLAKLLKSNQSRVAKMEAGDPSVSIDLLIKSLLALGTSYKDLAGIISQN
jgi:DNA-binding XRE family transcriptional regulator